MNTWFRFYHEVLDDPKVQRLNHNLFKAWVNMLCIASKHDGRLPDMQDVAYMLRMTETKAEALLKELVDAGLFEWRDGIAVPHNWTERQFQSDTSSARVERYRQKRRALGLPILSDYSQFRPALIQRDGERCVYCEALTSLVVDHMVPIELGGTDAIDNLALACKRCNSGKAGRTPEGASMVIRVTTAVQSLQRYRDTHTLVTVTESVTDGLHQNRTDQNRTPIVPTGDSEYPPDFLEFWTAYPSKKEKLEAAKVWKKLRPSQDLKAKILSAVELEKQSRDWTKDNGQYIPNPAKWLRRGNWENQPLVMAAVASGPAQFKPINPNQ